MEQHHIFGQDGREHEFGTSLGYGKGQFMDQEQQYLDGPVLRPPPHEHMPGMGQERSVYAGQQALGFYGSHHLRRLGHDYGQSSYLHQQGFSQFTQTSEVQPNTTRPHILHSGSQDQLQGGHLEHQDLSDSIDQQYHRDVIQRHQNMGTYSLEQGQDRFTLLFQQEFASMQPGQKSCTGNQGHTRVGSLEQEDQQYLDVVGNTEDMSLLPQSQRTPDKPDSTAQQGTVRRASLGEQQDHAPDETPGQQILDAANGWQYHYDKTKGRFTCLVCHKSSTTKSHILDHMARRHKVEGPGISQYTYDANDKPRTPYVCSICNQAYALIGDVLSHILDQHPKECLHTVRSASPEHPQPEARDEKPEQPSSYVLRELGYYRHHAGYRCLSCRLLCSSEPEFQDHISEIHSKSRESTYAEAGEKPRWNYKLRKWLCTICSRECRNEPIILHHILNHSEQHPLLCPLCKYSTHHRSYLTIHLKRKHKSEKGTLVFPVRTPLDLVYGERRGYFKWDAGLQVWTCTVCGESYDAWHSAKAHEIRMSTEPPIPCPCCEDSAMTVDKMWSHIRLKHGEDA